jgi:excisionase family DNA binding protein
MNDFYTVSELAKELKTSRQTIINWINNGNIKAIELPNKRYRIPVKEVEKIKSLYKEVKK